MKKLLLTVAALATIPVCVNAQTRMTINEEFTGENCPPCASTNPGFWHLCDTAPNLTKLIHITYMEPIPSSGWYYMRTKTLSDARDAYYSISSAPHAMYDGHTASPSSSSPGHPFYFSQAEINTEAAIASPFNMTCTNAWNSTFDSVITTVTITCVTPYSVSAPFLRAALVQTNNFATPPGTNGEKDFENVVQAMYPDATGTSLSSTTWTTGTTRTITLRGACPNFVDKSKAPYMVVWIQNDGDKSIAQAAQATPLPDVNNDAASATVIPDLVCSVNGPYTVAHTVTLTNSGANPVTSAKIYYQIDGGTWASTPWSGTLAVGASTTVTMPTATVTVSGPAYHSIYDSVANVNAGSDPNPINNTSGSTFFIESKTATAMPYSTSFEGSDYMVHYASDVANDNVSWIVTYNTTTPLGHTGAYAVRYNCNGAANGVGNFYTLPIVTTSAASEMDFWVSYCQVSTANNDKLEVVYSADCGANWTSIWNMSGTPMATVPANSTAFFYPSSPTQYAKHTVLLNAVPAGAMIGFRATANYGNNLFVDDVNIHSTLGVASIGSAPSDVNVYPNPATDEANLNFTVLNDGKVSISVYDAVGRLMFTNSQSFKGGQQHVALSVADYAAGVYNVVVTTDAGSVSSRFSVVK